MRKLNMVSKLHEKTSRDHFARMLDDKVHCMTIAREYGREFWDGNRRYGYGGHKYIEGYWTSVVQNLIDEFELQDGMSVLDIGCGKGFLLYEFKKLLPNMRLVGLDISQYALDNCCPEVAAELMLGDAKDPLPFQDKEFDLG